MAACGIPRTRPPLPTQPPFRPGCPHSTQVRPNCVEEHIWVGRMGLRGVPTCRAVHVNTSAYDGGRPSLTHSGGRPLPPFIQLGAPLHTHGPGFVASPILAPLFQSQLVTSFRSMLDSSCFHSGSASWPFWEWLTTSLNPALRVAELPCDPSPSVRLGMPSSRMRPLGACRCRCSSAIPVPAP